MADGVILRQARPADGPAVLALWLALLDDQSELEPIFGPAEDAAERWRNDYPDWLHDDTWRIVVAERDEGLIGFVTARRWAPVPVYRIAEEVYINELYVQPGWRGQGIGRRLVAAVREWAAALGAERIRVGVLAANHAGRGFWEHLGAQPLAVTMVLDVPPDSTERPRRERRPFGFR